MNALASILVIEDDATIRAILGMTLKNAGFERVKAVARGDEGLELIRQTRPSLVLLDLMLPGLDGLTVCRRVRENPELAETRIIMLTAKSENADIVRGLDMGADDYVTKPFSREILLARIHAMLRRQDPMSSGKMLDGLLLDEAGNTARLGEKVLTLTRLEFRILALMAARPGRVYTRQQIIDATQGEDRLVTERTVDVQIVGLRKKLGAWAAHIETIRGVGYRVKP
ncbi:MAG: response regulator transcription factor [Kiritimatiellia bacterium]